ncbi:hypothetical protein GCM10009825_41240 [Arthrobacter humicola]|uniref:FlgD Ig-like domain-containing protein n=1 Tax=Arthrobacter humicola TaxID=409291 RepID=A0ABN2ZT81_9MICC
MTNTGSPAGGQSALLTMGQTCTTYNGNQEINNLPAGQYVLEWSGTNNASGPTPSI